MNSKLTFEADWERLDGGSPEERATFAAIGIRSNDIWLTEAEDAFVNRVRQKVPLSGYGLAEWLAWNWWRLRWEPRRQSNTWPRYPTDWAMAHRMTTIGGGYVWPNITIISDGERIVLVPQPTAPRPAEPLRYICQTPVIVPASEYENAVDLFLEQVQGQLREEKLVGTNFEEIWKQVLEERGSPELTRRRRFEALLGLEPDSASETQIDQLLEDSIELGESGVQELAAAQVHESASRIKAIAERVGFEAHPRDAVQLQDRSRDVSSTDVAAWRRGVAAARSLREQEGLGSGPISNKRLCQLAGVAATAIESEEKVDSVSFALDHGPIKGAVVLRSRYKTGRRFDLARLLGDRVAHRGNGAFKPATRSYTYRQKMQRAFAGEFLCPFNALVDRLRGDFSDESIQEVADYYSVSDWTVRTLLMNHELIERASFLDQLDTAA